MRIAGSQAGHAYLQDYSQLDTALSADDLAGAQQAFGSLGRRNAADPVQADLDELEAAIQAGDLSGARTAFEQLQKDIAAAQRKELESQVQSPTSASVSLLA